MNRRALGLMGLAAGWLLSIAGTQWASVTCGHSFMAGLMIGAGFLMAYMSGKAS